MSTISPSLKFVMNLSRLQAALSRRFNRLSIHGISLTDFMILSLLDQAAGRKLRRIDLAESVGLTASGITRMLLPLEKIGLVEREASERDARVSYVVLTAAGKDLYEHAKDTANAIAKETVPPDVAKSLSLVELYRQLGITLI